MLPLTISSYFWAGYQVVCQTIRRRHYEQILQNLLTKTSVTVCQKKISQEIEQLDNIPSGSSTLEFEDDFIQLHNLHSLKVVNLGSWTCYSTSSVTRESSKDEFENVYVIVETCHAVEEVKKIHPDLKVHALGLGQPVAWRSTDHFDVIINCGLPGLVQMIDAFGQNRLHLDEDLKIKGFATIQPSGLPQTLNVPESSCLEAPTTAESVGQSTQAGDKGGTIKKGLLTNRLSEFMPVGPESSKTAQIISSQDKKVDASQSSHSSPKSNGKEDPPEDNKKRAAKPPNVLVYCGADDNSKQTYASIRSGLNLCINADVYIIYHLTHIEMLTSPWMENTALLLLSSCPKLSPEVEHKVREFVFNNSGSLLSFNTSVDAFFAQKIDDSAKDASQLFTFKLNDSHTVTCLQGNAFYTRRQGVSETIVSVADGDIGGVHAENDSHQKALVLKTELDNGSVVVLSQLVLEKDPAQTALDSSSFIALKSSNTARLAALQHVLASLGMNVSPRATPDLTPCCLLSKKQDLRRKFLNSVHRKLDKESVLKSRQMSLSFLEKVDLSKKVLSDLLPVVTGESNIDDRLLEGFAEQDYWYNLDTSKMGQIVLYTDVITSTMPVFEGMLFALPHGLSPVAIAGRQTSGRGRGGNMWLSPRGCAMFTFPIACDLNSEIGQRISFVQHLVSTAVVHGIRTLPGYENLNLRLKWPNDIYYGKDMKLGGVIVTSTILGQTIYSTIGCGVNVSNSEPTICINDIIELVNRSSKGSIPLLTPAGVIARTLSTLEKLLAEFEKHGHTHFCEIYYKYWLHGGVKVSLNLETEDGHGEGEIVGLDEYGFLSVRKPSGETISVQPDGNSFDMMQNLVYCKRRL